MELRCEGNILHGLLVDQDDVKPQGTIEFRCRSKFCGKAPHIVVLHRFDLATGEVHTHQYRDTPTIKTRKESA